MLATSHDSQWAVLRRGRTLSLYASGALVRTLTLPDEDDAITFVGPPTVLARVSNAHAPVPTRIELLSLPSLAVAAHLDLDARLKLFAVNGPRLALVGPDHLGHLTKVVVVRTAGHGLAAQPLDTNGVPVENIAGTGERWWLVLRKDAQQFNDAISARLIGRPQLPLPPAPRMIGAALGHVWVTPTNSETLFIYRMSDGRPFRHHAGATIQAVICHPASPVIVVVTPRGLVRLHCQAHSLSLIESPWVPNTDLALLAPGAEDVSLLGIPPDSETPWRVPISKPHT